MRNKVGNGGIMELCDYPLNIFEDKIEFAASTESLAKVDNVFLLESTKHLQLPQSGPLHISIVCNTNVFTYTS